jgi:hypothetical protein
MDAMVTTIHRTPWKSTILGWSSYDCIWCEVISGFSALPHSNDCTTPRHRGCQSIVQQLWHIVAHDFQAKSHPRLSRKRSGASSTDTPVIMQGRRVLVAALLAALAAVSCAAPMKIKLHKLPVNPQLRKHLHANKTRLITRQENGAVVARLQDGRPVQWRFATGPLPRRMPVDRLETPWWLLTV